MNIRMSIEENCDVWGCAESIQYTDDYAPEDVDGYGFEDDALNHFKESGWKERPTASWLCPIHEEKDALKEPV